MPAESVAYQPYTGRMALTSHKRALQRQQALVPEAPTQDEEPSVDPAPEVAPEPEPEFEISGTASNWDEPTELIDGPAFIMPEPRAPAAFVRITGDQVGRYPRDSIVPALTFEYLNRLLELGVVEYDHEATEQHIAGDPASVQLLADLQSAHAQVLPTAPWVNASPANLLGARYIPLLQSSQTWSPPAGTVPTPAPPVPEVTRAPEASQFEVIQPGVSLDSATPMNATQQVRDF